MRRSILFLILLVALLPAVFLSCEHFRGSHQLAAAVREMKSMGEPLDFQELKPAPIPAHLNGAEAQDIAITMLLEENQPDRFPDPPPIEFAAPGRAIPASRLPSWTSPMKSNTWHDVETWRSSSKDALAALAGALEKPARQPRLNDEVGFWHLQLPHLQTARITIKCLSLTAEESAHRGDFEGALAAVQAMHRVESDLATEPILQSQETRIHCASTANARLWSLAHARPWNEAQLKRLQEALPPGSFAKGVIRGLEGNLALEFESLRDRPPAELAAQVGLVGPLGKYVLGIWRFGWGDQACATLLGYAGARINTWRKLVDQGSFHAVQAQPWPPAPPYSRLARLHSDPLYIFVLPKLKVTPTTFRAAFQADTDRALNVAGLALRRFQLQHGNPPARLDDLIPQFLSSMPMDGMNGHPLRYRVNADGSFTLWSVGDNLTDDNGNPAWPVSTSTNGFPYFQPFISPPWWRGIDAVWPSVATDLQISEYRPAAVTHPTMRSPKPVPINTDLMKRYGLMPAPPKGKPREK